MSSTNKRSRTKLVIAIKKSEGMLKKIMSMIEEDASCANLTQQINATIGLLKSANATILKNHLSICGIEVLSSGKKDHIEPFIGELIKVRDISNRE